MRHKCNYGYIRYMTERNEHFWTAGDVARAAGVSRTTVRRWVEEGLLKPHSKTLGGHFRFQPDVVIRTLAERKQGVH